MKKGFTLIEMLLVIALFMILAGLSTPFYARFLTQNNVNNVVDQLSGQLRKAQIYAMMGRQNGAWGVTVNSGAIILFQGSSYATRNSAFDEKFLLNPNISITGLTEVVFAKVSGLPSTTPTIVITGNNSSKTVTVNSQGVINKL
jgi:prepilin-type N-terminal cleavage/methylation domain-containing protein